MTEQDDRLREQVARAQIAAAQARSDAAALDIPSAMDEAAVQSGEYDRACDEYDRADEELRQVKAEYGEVGPS